MERWDPRENLVLKDLKDLLDLAVTLVHEVPKVLLDHQARREI